MEINRKRVARRLVSGLVAGALALGGLAISGGSPAGATTPKSPTTNRLAGDDRYETAAEIARGTVASGSSTGLVIVSGESTADSLAAASLATATRPVLLVKKDSIPEATADFISDYKADWVSGTPKIYVIGGENAISSEVFDALAVSVKTAGDSTPATPTRISGDDRYATSAAVAAKAMNSSDWLVIANGAEGKWADALSIGGVAAKGTWPILLTNGSELSDDVKSAIDDYLALPGSAGKALIVGGPAAVSPSIEDYLFSDAVGFAIPDVRRIGGVDRYNTSFLVNVWAATESQFFGSFNTDNIAFASGVSPWDALAASGWAVAKSAHIVLVPSVGSDVWSSTLMATASAFNDGFSNQDVNVYLLGGKSVLPSATLSAASAAANSDLSATLTGCIEGGNTATLTLSGRLKDATGTGSPTEETGFDGLYGVAAQGDRFELNGVDQDGADLVSLADLGALTGVPTRQVFLITLGNSQTFDSGDILEFEGWAEDVTYTDGTDSHKASRSIGAASCEVAEDVTGPVATFVRAYPGDQGDDSGASLIEVRFNEPVTISGAVGTINNVTNGDDNSITAVATPVGSSGTNYLINFDASDTMADWDALDVISIDAASIKDLALNEMDEDLRITVAADSSLPVLSVSAVECDNSTSNYSMTKGSLTIAASGTGKFSGARGAGFSMSVVSQRGLLVPQVAIDETARTITVTADVNYHSSNDVAAIMAQSWLTSSVLGNWSVSSPSATKLTATTSPVVATGGTSTCKVDFSANEYVIVDDGTYSLGGGLSGLGTVAITGGAAYVPGTGAVSTAAKGSVTFTIVTAALGSGSIVVSSTAGITNLNDLYVALPLDVTLS